MKRTTLTIHSMLLFVALFGVAHAQQVVWVDFDSETDTGADPSDFIYSASDRTGVLGALSDKFFGLGVTFTDTMPTTGLFSKVTLNFGSGGSSGGVDFQNKKKSDSASVHAPALLDFVGESSPTPTEVLIATVNVTAHEVGHLLGARHDDAFLDIGAGVAPGPFADDFGPAYPGPSAAAETYSEIMAANTGFTITKDIYVDPDLYFGPRSSAKILQGAAPPLDVDVDETASMHDSVPTAQVLPLKTFEIPNHFPAGHPAEGVALFVDMVIVEEATLTLSTTTGMIEADHYSVSGFAGDIFQIEALSATISHQSDIDDEVDMQIAILDDAGAGGLYYGELGNDDERLSLDSTIIDFILPYDGEFTIEVFPSSKIPDPATDPDATGEYELYVVRYRAVPAPSADFDEDDDVDGFDFLAWQRSFGLTSGATKAQGDADDNGTVDAADLDIWETQYGTKTLLTSAATVPEPTTCTLALVSLCWAVSRRRIAVR